MYIIPFEKMFESEINKLNNSTIENDMNDIQVKNLQEYVKNYGEYLGKLLYLSGNSISLSR